MMSAVKMVVAAAVVALFGGFLLAGAIGDSQEGEPLPPAADSPSPTTESVVDLPTPFSGTFACTTYWEDGTKENVVVGAVEDGNLVRRETRGFLGRFEAQMSDPRLEGDWTAHSATDEYFWPGVDTTYPLILQPGEVRVANAEGSWGQMPWSFFALPGEWLENEIAGDAGTGYLVGSGGYEGLIALFEAQRISEGEECYCFVGGYEPRDTERCAWEIEGLILEADLPTLEVPE